MSGYLRWLAERAVGPASGLRPARRPRAFAGEPPRRSDSVAAFAATARPRDFSDAERQFDAPSLERTDAAMPATPPASAASPAAARTDAFAVAAALHDTDTPAPQPGSDAERHVEHAEPSGTDDRPWRAGSEIADDATSPPIPDRRGLVPQPVFAPRMATRLARNRPAPDPSDRQALPAPDVHIHIGRVELTAVTPAAAPRRESAASKKPMSLEEYLRQRSGRPS